MSRMEPDPRVHLAARALDGIDRMIMVCSVKGGVGKSTVATGLSLGLSELGRRVGLMDLDVTGTSLRKIMRVSGGARGDRRGIVPVTVGGVKVMSTAIGVREETLPVVGSEAESLALSFLSVVNWGELDYLIADMPPGMGDELMALLRLARPKATALLVTTPSVLSLSVVGKLASFLRDEGVPITGTIENMSYVTCKCGNVLRPFGEIRDEDARRTGLGRTIAKLPIDPELEATLSRGLSVLDAPILGPEFRRLARLVDGRAA